jgi:hypothetical protein
MATPGAAPRRDGRPRDGLARLKPAERRALSLLTFGYSYREIMAATGWTYTKANLSIRDERVTLRRGSKASSPI